MRKTRAHEEDAKEQLRAAIDNDLLADADSGKKGTKISRMYDAARLMIERLRQELEQERAKKEPKPKEYEGY